MGENCSFLSQVSPYSGALTMLLAGLIDDDLFVCHHLFALSWHAVKASSVDGAYEELCQIVLPSRRACLHDERCRALGSRQRGASRQQVAVDFYASVDVCQQFLEALSLALGIVQPAEQACEERLLLVG